MKFKSLLLGVRAPLIVAGAVAVATLVPHAKALIVQGGSYPATVCPGALSGGVQRISLPAQRIATRLVAAKSEKLTLQKSSVIAGGSAPTFVSGNPGSALAFESVTGTSTADAACEVGGIDQWFIGGSAGVTSQSVLQIINSGLSDSMLQIFPYNSKVALAPIAVTVKANSAQNIALSAIAPGDEAVALHLVTESGRVSSFLLDHRRAGLNDLGASFVTPVAEPATVSYISGILPSSSKVASTMRFLVPGNLDANVHLSIFSGEGTFTPVGFDSVTIAHQKVVDLPLPLVALSGAYGIQITSDQPLFASTLTRTSGSGADFAWAGQLNPLSNFSLNLAGARAQFFFMGKTVSLHVNWVDAKGKSKSALIVGGSSASWRPVGALHGVTFKVLSKQPIYGGAIVANVDGGINYLPLLANQLISRAQAPVADLRTLTRH